MRILLVLFAFALLAPVMSADTKFTLTDYSNRGFAPDLVQYRITTNASEVKNLRLTREDGTPVAVQVEDLRRDGTANLSFVAGVPASDPAFWLVLDQHHPAGTRRWTEDDVW